MDEDALKRDLIRINAKLAACEKWLTALMCLAIRDMPDRQREAFAGMLETLDEAALCVPPESTS